jgi:Rrf2 family protein
MVGGLAMRINKGVEWAVHACALLAPLPPGTGLSLAALAQFHGVPEPYMAKQMQALRRAGLVRASRGKTGGYALARPARTISLFDIKTAIDGPEPAFRCTEIRQNGPCRLKRKDCLKACPIAAAFGRAEEAYREVLDAISVSDVVASVSADSTADHLRAVLRWLDGNATSLPHG